MARQDAPSGNPLLEAVHEGSSRQGFDSIRLETRRGPVQCRLYPVPEARGVILFGGVAGDWDTPAHGLYPRLCAELPSEGITCLRLKYRDPIDLPEAEYDVLTGIEYLQRRHVRAIALVGHSSGGAAAVRAAARSAAVTTVVALATQSYGADAASELGPRCSLLLIHGLDDRTLSPTCSVRLHQLAKDPKRLELLPGVGHQLDEAAEAVFRDVRRWIVQELHQAEPEPGIQTR